MTPSLHILLTELIDYAGLFPPAELGMPAAVRNYAGYLSGEQAWALGRFIVPIARLEEFDAAAAEFLPGGPVATPWRLSLLGSSNPAEDVERLLAFNDEHAHIAGPGSALIDAIEIKATTAEGIISARRPLPEFLETYFEIPITSDPGELVAAIARAGGCAKVRTGGVTPEMFPSAFDLVRFIGMCVNAKVPFKATAGLHHPVRSIHRLTYAPDSPLGTMYGFLNVFLTAAFLENGMAADEARQVLEEEYPTAFVFDEEGVGWRSHRLENRQLFDVRQRVAISFGSCSFDEPISDLKSLNLL